MLRKTALFILLPFCLALCGNAIGAVSGLFTLEHSWLVNGEQTKGKTGNLMDYGYGTQLTKYQWDMAHNPELVIGMLEDDEDAMQKATKDQINVALEYLNTTELNESKSPFKHIKGSTIKSQIELRIKELGKPIFQGKFFLCGPAAACYVAAYHDPEKYVKTIFDLYMTGKANDGKIEDSTKIYEGKLDAKAILMEYQQ